MTNNPDEMKITLAPVYPVRNVGTYTFAPIHGWALEIESTA
jgi:hypothetical protein